MSLGEQREASTNECSPKLKSSLMAPSAAPLVYSSTPRSRSAAPPHRAAASHRPVGAAAAPVASSVHLAEEGEIHTMSFFFPLSRPVIVSHLNNGV